MNASTITFAGTEFTPVNVPGFPQFAKLYAVSRCGKVLSLARTCKTKGGTEYTKPAKMLSSDTTDSAGYYHVVFTAQNVRKLIKIHRLVMLTFNYVDNHAQLVVDHIDNTKTNNDISNLQWLTPAQNAQKYHDDVATGVHRGVKKLTDTDKRYIDKFHSEFPILTIADRLNIGYPTVANYFEQMGYRSDRQIAREGE